MASGRCLRCDIMVQTDPFGCISGGWTRLKEFFGTSTRWSWCVVKLSLVMHYWISSASRMWLRAGRCNFLCFQQRLKGVLTFAGCCWWSREAMMHLRSRGLVVMRVPAWKSTSIEHSLLVIAFRLVYCYFDSGVVGPVTLFSSPLFESQYMAS